jgi:hypothetical protein
VRAAGVLFSRTSDLEHGISTITDALEVRSKPLYQAFPSLPNGLCCIKGYRLSVQPVHQTLIFLPHALAIALYTVSVSNAPGELHYFLATQERDLNSLHDLLGWFTFTRFSNPTGHYEFNLTTPVHQALTRRLKVLRCVHTCAHLIQLHVACWFRIPLVCWEHVQKNAVYAAVGQQLNS